MIYEFPAIFYDDEKQIAFHFYDRQDWFLCADNLASAIEMAQDVLSGALLELEQKGEPIPKASRLAEIQLQSDQTVRMIQVDTAQYARELDRASIFDSDNPIRELLNRRNLKIKQLSDALEIPYRTCQDWANGKSSPPKWALKLIIEKIF